MWIKLEVLADQLKVSWGHGTGDFSDPYFIGPKSLETVAAKLRDELKRMAVWARSSDPAQRWAGLTALAKAGSDVRYELFNDRQNRERIRDVETWIADVYQGGVRDLAIQADSSVHVPWGVIFDGAIPREYAPPSNALDASEVVKNEMAAFGGFWALKYRLSATPSGDRRPPSRMTRPRKTFGLLSLVNKDIQTQIEADLGESKYREFCELLSPPVGIAYNLDTCQDMIDKSQQVDILFHFLGHHDKDLLDLGSGGKVDYTDFSRLLDSLTEREYVRGAQPCGLLFVNGCESAVGDEDFTLRSETKRPALSGIIATESVVRRTYAAEFGLRFLKAMVLGGETVANTMDQLHHDPALWPESLLYGCYARPEYCIEKPAAPAGVPSAAASADAVAAS